MIEQLRSELKKKYAGQTTNEYLENLAERLAAKVEKEDEIEGVLKELESSPVTIADLQVEGDRRVRSLRKELDELRKKKPEPPKPEPPKPDDVSAQIAELKREIESERKERQRQAARAELYERIKDKQIPRALIDDVVINTTDEVDDTVERLVAKTEALKKEWGTVSPQDPPKKGDPNTGNRKQVIEDLKNFKAR